MGDAGHRPCRRAAPAFAASPGYDFFVECSKATIGFRTAGASWTKLVGTLAGDEVKYQADGNDVGSTIDTSTTDGANDGTEWNIQAGNPHWTATPDPSITGVKFYADVTRDAIVRTANGIVGTATVTGVGITTPQVATSGLSTSYALQSTIPYKGACPGAGNTLASVSIPVVLVWLRGTSETSPRSNQCPLYLNYCYGVAPDAFGCYPTAPLVTGYSLTTQPEVPC